MEERKSSICLSIFSQRQVHPNNRVIRTKQYVSMIRDCGKDVTVGAMVPSCYKGTEQDGL